VEALRSPESAAKVSFPNRPAESSEFSRPLTALASVLIIGRAERFQCGKQIGCYLGLVPLEDSSGQQRRPGHTRNKATRCCVFFVEATRVTVRSLPGVAE
jgi:transposase